MFSRSVAMRRVVTRRMSTVFESKNMITEKRAKFYSNPAVGKFFFVVYFAAVSRGSGS